MDNFGKIKEDAAAGWLLLVFLDKLTKDRDELSDKTDPIQVYKQSKDFSECVLAENLFSSHSAQVADNQTEVLL